MKIYVKASESYYQLIGYTGVGNLPIYLYKGKFYCINTDYRRFLLNSYNLNTLSEYDTPEDVLSKVSNRLSEIVENPESKRIFNVFNVDPYNADWDTSSSRISIKVPDNLGDLDILDLNCSYFSPSNALLRNMINNGIPLTLLYSESEASEIQSYIADLDRAREEGSGEFLDLS